MLRGRSALMAPVSGRGTLPLPQAGARLASWRPEWGRQRSLTSCPGMLVRTARGKYPLWLPWPRTWGEGGLRGQRVPRWSLTPRPLVSDDSSSESGSGNGSSTLNPSTSSSTQGDPAFPEMNGNGTVAPVDFTATAEDQPINLCDKLPQGSALGMPSYPSDADGLRSRVKYGVKTTPEVCGAAGCWPAGAGSLCRARTRQGCAGLT